MMTDDVTTARESTFIDDLRQATAESHTRLESLAISASLMTPSLTEVDYATYLSLMSGIVEATETEVLPMISEYLPDGSMRSKLHLIKSDLEKLTYAGTPAPFHFNPKSAAFAFGIFYVVEGSTLGGRYILRNVATTLGHDGESGASYFNGYGNATGSMWKKFLNVLSNYAAATGQHNEIIAGAKFAFDSIHNHFETACK